MLSDLGELIRCRKLIEQKLDWGKSEHWQSADFENLNQLILDETGVSLSVSTLRRIWGRVEYKHLPSVTTLNALAKFAGYEDWRNFVKKHSNPQADVVLPSDEKERKVKISKRKLVWIISAVFILGLISFIAFKKGEPQIKKEAYAFSSRPVTRDIPNSVIFTYDASTSPTDSVFIQQSWDKRERTLVDKNSKKHTSVYYEPGFYVAKLIVGNQVVKQHKLLIATNGWLGTIGKKPVPVYLESSEYIKSDRMQLPVSSINKKNITMQPEPPFVHYYNVGNFDPVFIRDFSFVTDIKNEYREGASACQLSAITLVTDDVPIVIPLSVKGCVSEINMLSIDNYISGKKTDLSAFGVDFTGWNQVSCKSNAGKIQYFVNNKLAVEYPIPKREIKIIGLSYTFQGTGSVKNIRISNHEKVVFHAFDNQVTLSKK